MPIVNIGVEPDETRKPLPLKGAPLRARVEACLNHARDLLRAARALLDNENLPHIAYHLAALALEETGKAGMIFVSQVVQPREGQSGWAEKRVEDHAAKLFWAIWSPGFSRKQFTRQEVEQARELANTIHENRLRGLYVEAANDALAFLPSDAVTAVQAKDLIELTEARLQLEEMHDKRAFDLELTEELKWYLDSVLDPLKAPLIFGKVSLSKLNELGSVREWAAWLKEQFRQNEEDNRSLIEKELQRQEPSEGEAMDDKWKLRIRLVSLSHSVRPGVLAKWSEQMEWFKLISIDKPRRSAEAYEKGEFYVDFKHPKKIPIEGLWHHGWGVARLFVTALNIGTFGFFWWETPRQIDRFYEHIDDVEKNAEVRVTRSPSLAIEWGKRALSLEDLQRVALVFSFLPKPRASEAEQRPFGRYLRGLAFMAKTDVHLQLEVNAFEQFFYAVKDAMKLYGDWDGDEDFERPYMEFAGPIAGNMAQKLFEYGKKFESGSRDFKGLTMEDVAGMKVICDYYLFRQMEKVAQRAIRGAESS